MPAFSPAEVAQRRFVAEAAARAAASVHMSYRSAGIEYDIKKNNRRDLVTMADIEGEAAARSVIESAFPGETIVGEEGGTSLEAQAAALGDACWVIDPLDGTFMFVHGFPDFSATIGFVSQGEAMAGATFAPALDEMFSAAKGQGATLNGRRIEVSPRRGLENAIVTVWTGEEDNAKYGALEARLRSETFAVRSFGGAAIVLAYVACGRVDAYFVGDNHQMGPWDMAAGVVLVQEAGGVITRADGSPFALPATSINTAADAETLRRLRKLVETI